MTDSVFKTMREMTSFFKPSSYKSGSSLRPSGSTAPQPGCETVCQKQPWLHSQQTQLGFGCHTQALSCWAIPLSSLSLVCFINGRVICSRDCH